MSVERLVWSGLAALVIVSVSLRLRSLSFPGAVAAWVAGSVTYVFGGWAAVVPLLFFFVSGSLLSRWPKRPSKAISLEKPGPRDGWQVLANGGLATVFIVLAFLFPSRNFHLAFLAAYAEAGADTWATEIGLLSRIAPRSIISRKMVSPGTSGGVTALGLLAGFVGALFTAACGFWIQQKEWGWTLGQVALAGTSGFAGSLFDSVLGATVQQKFRCPDCGQMTERRECRCGGKTVFASGIRGLNNDWVNFLSTFFSAGFALLLVGLFAY